MGRTQRMEHNDPPDMHASLWEALDGCSWLSLPPGWQARPAHERSNQPLPWTCLQCTQEGVGGGKEKASHVSPPGMCARPGPRLAQRAQRAPARAIQFSSTSPRNASWASSCPLPAAGGTCSGRCSCRAAVWCWQLRRRRCCPRPPQCGSAFGGAGTPAAPKAQSSSHPG